MPSALSQSLSLKGRALKYLAAREHSRAELRQKLQRHAESDEALDQVLDELTARGFLSDSRFVASVVHRRADRFGAARIRQELQSKGVDAESTRDALASLQASEPERALAVWRSRFGTVAADAREQARQMRFLLARGFSAEVVRRTLRAAGTVVDDEG